MNGSCRACQAPSSHSFDEKSGLRAATGAAGGLEGAETFDDGKADVLHLGFVQLASHVEAVGHYQFESQLERSREVGSLDDRQRSNDRFERAAITRSG